MKIEKYPPVWDNPEPERRIWYALIFIWILAVKSMISKLQSIEQQRTGIESGTRENIEIFLSKGRRVDW